MTHTCFINSFTRIHKLDQHQSVDLSFPCLKIGLIENQGSLTLSNRGLSYLYPMPHFDNRFKLSYFIDEPRGLHDAA
jgi:hypothetical protein